MRVVLLSILCTLTAYLYAVANDGLLPLQRSEYRVELHAICGVGATWYTDPPSRYSNERVFTGYNGNMRIMWHPDHLLGVGVMTGYQVFSLERFSPAPENDLLQETKMQLGSIPIHAVFEMQGPYVRIGAGIGTYILLSQLHEGEAITYSSSFAFGGSAWIGYAFSISDRLRIGPDVVVQVISDRGIGNVSAMVTVQIDVLSY